MDASSAFGGVVAVILKVVYQRFRSGKNRLSGL